MNINALEDRVYALEGLVIPRLYWPVEQVQSILSRPGSRVLDVGNAGGIWALGLEDEFKGSEMVVVDRQISPPSFLPPGYRFENLDPATDDMTKLGLFDLVHFRRNGRTTTRYGDLVKKVAETVKVGGLLLLYEGDMGIYERITDVATRIPPTPDNLPPAPGTGADLARVLDQAVTGSRRVSDTTIDGWAIQIAGFLKANNMKDIATPRTIYANIGVPSEDETDNDVFNRKDVTVLMKEIHVNRARHFRWALKSETAVNDLERAQADIDALKKQIYGVWHLFATERTEKIL